jgi:RND family efflux transporter MFP subunit
MSLRSAGALLLAGCLAACSGETQTSPSTQAAQLKPREATRVRVSRVEQREMVRRLETTTVVESDKEIKLYPRVAGTVTAVLAEEGDRVEKDAVLAQLDDRDARAKVAEAEVSLREAADTSSKLRLGIQEAEVRVQSTKLAMEQKTREYERNARTEGVVTELALDQLRLSRDTTISDHEAAKLALERAKLEASAAKTTEERARLALDRARLDLSWTSVTAPFQGVIASRSVKTGDTVSSAAPLFVLTDPTSLRAVFYRPQRELGFFQGDGKALAAIELTAQAEALPKAQFIGRVQLVSPSIDAQSGNFRVTVRLEPKRPEDARTPLLPGMLVRLSIVSERHPNALVVEKRALRREGELNLLFVAEEGKVRRLEVLEGFAEDLLVEVIPKDGAPLKAGDAVVVVGNRDLEDGAPIELEAQGSR